MAVIRAPYIAGEDGTVRARVVDTNDEGKDRLLWAILSWEPEAAIEYGQKLVAAGREAARRQGRENAA